ncbi:unnamed protein product [Rotaria sordida]|uniref:Uncharacterized protein n=1 Tax=Rotaria sordida TaxID=392033 RepID=A0A814WNK5_9BILA|nr:unnamed protein product [Rotaria sordida]CAF1207647.1 unnamed protein product [Rotaria sordida]
MSLNPTNTNRCKAIMPTSDRPINPQQSIIVNKINDESTSELEYITNNNENQIRLHIESDTVRDTASDSNNSIERRHLVESNKSNTKTDDINHHNDDQSQVEEIEDEQ